MDTKSCLILNLMLMSIFPLETWGQVDGNLRQGSSLLNSLDSAETLYNNGQEEQAFGLGKSVYAEAIRLKRQDLAIDALYFLGNSSYYSGNITDSKQYYAVARSICLAEGERVRLANILLELSDIYLGENKLDSTYVLVSEAYAIGEEENNLSLQLSGMYSLGLLYYYIGDYDMSIRSFQMGVEDAQNTTELSLEEMDLLSSIYGEYAGSLGEMQLFDSARYMYRLADSIATLLNDSSKLMANEYGIGYLNLYDGNYLAGIERCRKALDYFNSVRDIYYAEGCIECIGRGYYLLGKLDSALLYLENALESAHAHEFFDFKRDIYEILADIYAQKGDYKNALEYYKEFKAQNDSLLELERSSNISVIQSSFRYAQLRDKAEALQEYAKRDEKIITTQKKATLLVSLALILSIALTALLGYLFRIHKSRNRTLKEEVESRTAELSKINDSLLQANEELEEFAYISSHDLKEPIRNISSFSSMIQKKGIQIDKAELEDYVSFIQFNAKQMQQLVNAIYDFSRINKEHIQLTHFHVPDVIDDLTKVLETTIKENNAVVTTDIQAPDIISNRGMLFIVLRNLIENGLKYNTSDKPSVHIELKVDKNLYFWRVKDNGIGIDPKYHNRVFELFKRLHNREEFQGSGLGLSISYKIVHRLNGTMGVISEEGNGSEFWFTLPKLKMN